MLAQRQGAREGDRANLDQASSATKRPARSRDRMCGPQPSEWPRIAKLRMVRAPLAGQPEPGFAPCCTGFDTSK